VFEKLLMFWTASKVPQIIASSQIQAG